MNDLNNTTNGYIWAFKSFWGTYSKYLRMYVIVDYSVFYYGIQIVFMSTKVVFYLW